MPQAEYIAGVCNIGPAEIARRRSFGWATLAISVVLLAALFWAGADPWWRLFVFFPATMSASGFLQAYFRFCTGFAHKGVFNFESIGTLHQVSDEAFKTKDKTKGNQIVLYAVLIGAAISLASVWF
jgi:hypothetical protein